MAIVSNSQYSRSCLLVSFKSPSKVPLTIDKKVLDAVPPSLISGKVVASLIIKQEKKQKDEVPI